MSADEHDKINREIRREFNIGEDESPTINGLELTIFTGGEDEGARIGGAMVIKIETILKRYKQVMPMKDRLWRRRELEPEEAKKHVKRKGRVEKLQTILERGKKAAARNK